MAFVRPEIARAATQWREVLVLGSFGILGAWIALRPGFFFPIAGWAMVAIVVLLMPASIRRARFAPGQGGAGVVRLREGRLGYMGPDTGGTMALDELQRLSLLTRAGRKVWRLWDGEEVLEIPVDALGADQLFDAYARLPGLNSSTLVAALRQDGDGEITIWSRGPRPAPLAAPP